MGMYRGTAAAELMVLCVCNGAGKVAEHAAQRAAAFTLVKA